MEIKIRKITDVGLMREACEMTFWGKSKMSLTKMAKCEHSPLRTQMYWVQLYDIPLFCSTQLLRHHVGSQPFQLSRRTDRGAEDFRERIDDVIRYIDKGWDLTATNALTDIREHFDHHTPVNLGLFLNAQALINMAKERLCSDASAETREIFKGIVEKIGEVDPELKPFLVRKCVYRGGICNSLKPCGYNKSEKGKQEIENYKKMFN